MLKKDNFFKNYFINLSKYNKNLKKTKRVFNSFIVDLKNNQIPLLESYEKDYEFDFLKTTVKKFSKYINIIIIGMGGSILGTKSIYSFLKKNKKPLSITHPLAERYMFNSNEATRFILKCLTVLKTGEIFVPKMKSYKIKSLAQKYSKKQRIIGLRQGEKIKEILITEDEKKKCLEKKDMWVISPYN